GRLLQRRVAGSPPLTRPPLPRLLGVGPPDRPRTMRWPARATGGLIRAGGFPNATRIGGRLGGHSRTVHRHLGGRQRVLAPGFYVVSQKPPERTPACCGRWRGLKSRMYQLASMADSSIGCGGGFPWVSRLACRHRWSIAFSSGVALGNNRTSI